MKYILCSLNSNDGLFSMVQLDNKCHTNATCSLVLGTAITAPKIIASSYLRLEVGSKRYTYIQIYIHYIQTCTVHMQCAVSTSSGKQKETQIEKHGKGNVAVKFGGGPTGIRTNSGANPV